MSHGATVLGLMRKLPTRHLQSADHQHGDTGIMEIRLVIMVSANMEAKKQERK